jgi:hypothetical protein
MPYMTWMYECGVWDFAWHHSTLNDGLQLAAVNDVDQVKSVIPDFIKT